MSTWTNEEHEHARRQLAKHGRTWTIGDEELSNEENAFISEVPDLLHKALTEIERLQADNAKLTARAESAEKRASDAAWALDYDHQGGI